VKRRGGGESRKEERIKGEAGSARREEMRRKGRNEPTARRERTVGREQR
jgi:hypothetical protein